MEIIGEKIILRQIKETEVDALLTIINEPEIRFLGDTSLPFPIKKDSVLKYIGLTNNSSTYVYGIFEIESDTIIGNLAIHNFNLIHQNCEIGINISNKYREKGFGKESLQLIINFLFQNTPMHKIKINVFAFNQNAIKLYENLGFSLDGILREEIFKSNAFQDMLLYSLLKSEWSEVRTKVVSPEK